MAGDWIPLRLDLSDDPAVLAVCARTGLDEYAVIGRLHKLWCWANRHLKDGYAPGVTSAWVDQYVGRKGFAVALCAAEWLVLSEDGLSFPKFDNWNSKSAKKRLLDTRAKSMKRAGQFADNVRSASGQISDNSRTREEKRREELNPPYPPPGGEGGEELIESLAAATGKDSTIEANRKELVDAAAALSAANPPYQASEVFEFGKRWKEFCQYSSAKDRSLPFIGEVVKNIAALRRSMRTVIEERLRNGQRVGPKTLSCYPDLADKYGKGAA